MRTHDSHNAISLDQYLDTIHSTMFESMGLYYIKDLQGRFVYANKNEINILGFNRLSDLLGKTLKSTPNEKHHHLYIKNDQHVLALNKSHIFIEYGLNPMNQLVIATSHKKPFYYHDKLIGVEGLSLAIDLNSLTSTDNLTENTCFLDKKTQKIIALSPCQRRTLFYALKGHTAQKISNILSLSKRTVQNHLAAIKGKHQYLSLKDMLIHIIAI